MEVVGVAVLWLAMLQVRKCARRVEEEEKREEFLFGGLPH